VVLEEQLLPHTDLKPLYDKAVWLYVYRTFKEDEADRAAEDISIRFGLTSWPQLLLVDPVTLRVTHEAGRTVASFLQSFAAAQLPSKPDEPTRLAASAKLAAATAAVEQLVKEPGVDVARAKLADDDIVVKTRALEILAERAPAEVAPHATGLLATPSDPFRYLVCEVLVKHPDPKANDALEALVREPRDSRNPNVLRIRAVQALAASGDGDSVAVIAPHATSGVYFNGLTGIAVDALAAIAARHEDARAAARATLLAAYPAPPADDDARALRACVGLAKRVHKALGSRLPFPETYDAAARKALMEEKP